MSSDEKPKSKAEVLGKNNAAWLKDTLKEIKRQEVKRLTRGFDERRPRRKES
jgi:hypothetical protein